MSDVKPITKRLAEKTFAAMRKQFAAYLPDNPAEGPFLRRRYETSGHWEIVREGGPYDWPMRAFVGGWDSEIYHLALDAGATRQEADRLARSEPKIPAPADVFTEPVNGYTLGLYPAY